MKFCSKCGASVEDGFAYCGKCGAHVQEQTVVAPNAPATLSYSGNHASKCLNTLHKRLGYEKNAFLVIGILNVLGALFMLFIAATLIVSGRLVNGINFDYTIDQPMFGGYSGTAAAESGTYTYVDIDEYFDHYFDEYDDYYDDYYDDDYYDSYYDVTDDDIVEFASAFVVAIGVIYLIGGIFQLAAAVVNFVQVGRISTMMSNLYNDCAPAVKFCRSNGMIVLCVFFGIIPMVFHIVNRVFAIDHAEILDDIENSQKVNSSTLY